MTYVMVMVALPVLIGAAACAVDLSLMTAAGQRVQNVADQAALSGARSFTNEATARQIVQEVATANNAGSAWQVSPETACYGPGETVPDYGALKLDEYAVDVTGHADFAYFFGRMLGLDTTQVNRRAIAVLRKNDGNSDDTFIFAGATAPGVAGVRIMGQGITIDGDIHSNADIRLGGTAIQGDISHVGAVTMTGGCTRDGDDCQSPVLEYPIHFTWDQFDQGPWDYEVSSLSVSGSGAVIPSGRWRIHGDLNISGRGATCLNSLFVVDGDINATASNKILDGVTLVAKGEIRLSGSGSSYSPYQDNLLAFSLLDNSPDPSEQGISINAADCAITGIVFAPASNISVNGSREQSYHISVVGETIDLMGSHCTYTNSALPDQEDDVISDVRLVL